MKQLFEALTALLKVKTIVTLVIIVVLAVLSLNGSVERTSFSPSQQWSLRSILERRMKKSRSFPP